MQYGKTTLLAALATCLLTIVSLDAKAGGPSAGRVFAVPDGVVASADGINFWKVPWDGTPATKLQLSNLIPSFVTYAAGEYIEIAGGSSGPLMYSRDGVNWTSKRGGFNGRYADGSPFRVFQVSGGLLMTLTDLRSNRLDACVSSDEGTSWSCDSEVPNADTHRDGMACGGYFVAWAVKSEDRPNGPAVTRMLDFSSDGKIWKQVVVPTDSSNAMFCINDRVLISSAPSSYKEVLVFVTPAGFVARASVRWPAGGYSFASDGRDIFSYVGERVEKSEDGGSTFTPQDSGLSDLPALDRGDFSSPKYSHGMFVGIGMGGFSILQSHDGVHWKQIK